MNITNITITNLGDFLSIVNAEVQGGLAPITLIVLFVISFSLLSRMFRLSLAIFIAVILIYPVALAFISLGLLDSNFIFIYMLLIGAAAVFSYLW